MNNKVNQIAAYKKQLFNVVIYLYQLKLPTVKFQVFPVPAMFLKIRSRQPAISLLHC